MDVLRALCITLKNDTMEYQNKTDKELKEYLNEQNINSNLNVTKKQLDYIHSLDLDNLEDFVNKVDISLLLNRTI